MNNWAPLWSGLVDSSIWEEPDHVFRVFMALMSLKDRDHVVTYDGYRLAKRIHMEYGMVEEALKILSSPDRRRPGQEFDGRRIEAVEGGWKVLNGEFYRELVQKEMARARNQRAQAAWRARKKGKPLAGESASVRASEAGDEAGATAILEASLPEVQKPKGKPLVEVFAEEERKRAVLASEGQAGVSPGPAQEQERLEEGHYEDGVWVKD